MARRFQPGSSEQAAIAGRVTRRLLAAAVLTALVTAHASRAHAEWTRVSAQPSESGPYYVCPPHRHRARCALIDDPTRGAHVRGPVRAGAVTAGPVLEVSPAFSGGGYEGGYDPAELRSAYDLPSTSAGSGQTVAVVDAYDDPDAESDLAEYRSAYGIPVCDAADGCFRKVNETGGGAYPEANAKWAEEISLDLDMVSAICPNCHILLVEASSEAPANLAAAEDVAVHLGATEISNSYVEPSLSEPSEIVSAYDHPGIPITAAGGDEGYDEGHGVESPAANPHVIAVGGTALRPSGARGGWSETVWYEETDGKVSGTGSGCSQEPKPSWQTDAGCPFRTTNDVAAVADPNTPVSAYDSYETKSQWLLLGGTSVATPIVAGAMALASPYTRSFDGAEALYLEAASGSGGFNNIITGANGTCGNYLCEAGPGYNGPTGLGSLRGVPEAPPPTTATAAATAIGQTEATVHATVEPHGGRVSECTFQYGPSPSYGSSTPCTSLPEPSTEPVPVSATLTGLAAETSYHFEITIAYAGGTADGGDATFTTTGYAPSVSTGAPANVAQSAATLTAQVNPESAAVDECVFEYGASASYGSRAPCTPAPGDGSTPVAVSAAITGLTAGRTYHYRVRAANANGISYGGDRTLTTVAPAPAVVTEAAGVSSASSATLHATVDPNGSPVTSCAFEFDSAGDLLPCAAPPGDGEGPVAVTASLTGLPAGRAFAYRIVAANAGGTSYGSIVSFTTSALTPTLPGPIVTPPPPVAPLAALVRTTLTVSASGALTVRLSCPLGAEACRGEITLRTLSPVRTGRRASAKRVLTLAAGSFALTPGRVATLELRLSVGGRTLLRAARVLPAGATIVSAGAGDSSKQTAVTLRAFARPRRDA